MSMDKLPIPINIASPSEISTLYDISERRAQKIVEYRDQHGPFHGPTDLAQVKEITLKLADTLAPYIDWSLPEPPEPPKSRSWSDALFWGAILFCLLLASILVSVAANIVMPTLPLLSSPRISGALAGIGALYCLTAFAAFRLAVALTQSNERARQLAGFGIASIAIALFVAIPALFISIIIWSIMDNTRGESLYAVQQFTQPTLGLFSLALLYLFMVPQVLVRWRPQLRNSRWLACIFDLAFALSGVALTWGMSNGSEPWPPWTLVLTGIMGGFLVLVSVIAVRRGESFFQASLALLNLKPERQNIYDLNQWRYWLNTYLPDPAQQQSVKKALDQVYRPSLGQTLLQFVVFSFGSWIMSAIAGAIIELYTQGFWEKYIQPLLPLP